MQHNTENQQSCSALVGSLNTAYGWHLSGPELQQYTQFAETQRSRNPKLSDKLLGVMIEHYHTDRHRIEAMRDVNHAQHMDVCTELQAKITGIIRNKLARTYILDDGNGGVEDLTQSAITLVWQKLVSFRYESSFHTWVFAIVSNDILHHFRANGAKKRLLHKEAQSLDAMIEQGRPGLEASSSPEGQTLDQCLTELVEQTLQAHTDQRLLLIFQMSVTEEATLREIGAKLNLSPARVYALLKQAIAVLKSNPTIRDWLDSGDSSHIDA